MKECKHTWQFVDKTSDYYDIIHTRVMFARFVCPLCDEIKLVQLETDSADVLLQKILRK